ncbi:hypothetical protein QR98_0086370 [Sarcoptes scabiei]|uniref:Uncharacterized protein n=1 Tax=Sarcoptes scabiei TaxID=52283 RepID=A0A132AGH3_SARSC|nr:hypothetical protein QR98_0086370 [Sarcoptes scabiei]
MNNFKFFSLDWKNFILAHQGLHRNQDHLHQQQGQTLRFRHMPVLKPTPNGIVLMVPHVSL